MIIIPAEKRFDSKHPPIILLLLVIVNLLIYFVYQSGDNEKTDNALKQYQELKYFKAEKFLYQSYLEKEDQKNEQERFKLAQENNNLYVASYYLITDNQFYSYLDKRADGISSIRELEDDIDTWRYNRENINQLIQSTSALSYGLIPAKSNWYSFITHQFLHGGVMHLLGNLFFLVVCGFAVEASLGHLKFLGFYLMSGVGAGAFHALFDLSSNVPLVGASGAISGVMAMYLAIFRFKKIEFFYWVFIFAGYFRAPALLILPIYIGKEVSNYLSDTDSNVAFMAHAGGFISGLLLVFISHWNQPDSINIEYVEESEETPERQLILAKVYKHMENYRFSQAEQTLKTLDIEKYWDFDLFYLHYQLLRAINNSRNKEYYQSALEVLRLKRLDLKQIEKLAKIWRDIPDIKRYLKEEELINIGWQFVSLSDLNIAESIFEEINKTTKTPRELSGYARKLSIAFKATQDISKHKHYEKLAEQLL